MWTDAGASGAYTGTTGTTGTNVRVNTQLGVGVDPYTQLVVPGWSPTGIAQVVPGDILTDFKIQGRYLYIIGVTGTTVNLYIYDVTLPSSPTLISTTTTPVSSNGTPALAVQGRYAYISYENTMLSIYDISDPTLPYVVSTTAFNINSIIALVIQGRYLYAICHTASGNKQNYTCYRYY